MELSFVFLIRIILFVQPTIQSVAQTKPDSLKRSLSPVHDQDRSPRQSSDKALPQSSHSPPIKDDATESEVESLQYDKNPKPQKQSRSCRNMNVDNLLLFCSLSQKHFVK